MDTSGVGGPSIPLQYGYGTPDAAIKDGVSNAPPVGLGNAASGGEKLLHILNREANNDTNYNNNMTSPGGPGSADSEARVDAAVAQIEQIGKSLGLNVLVKAMVDGAGEQRKQALDARLQARQEASSQLLDEAGSLTKEASNMLKSAIISLVVGVVASAASIAGSLGSAVKAVKNVGKELEHKAAEISTSMAKIEHRMKDSSKAMQEIKNIKSEAKAGTLGQAEHLGIEKPAVKLTTGEERAVKNFAKLQTELSPLQAMMKKEQKIAGLLDGLRNASDLAQKSSEGGKSLVDSDNKRLEADQKGDEAIEQSFSSKEDIQKTTQDALTEMIQKILGFQQAQLEAQAEGMQALTRA